MALPFLPCDYCGSTSQHLVPQGGFSLCVGCWGNVKMLKEVRLAPAAGNIHLGEPAIFKAIAYWSDGSTSDVSKEAVWSCSDEEVTVHDGTVTPRAVGTVLITASYTL